VYEPCSNQPQRYWKGQVVDIYRPFQDTCSSPEPQPPLPVVIWVPGGAWFWNEHSHENPRECAKAVARNGFVVMTVNYRHCSHDYQLLECALAGLLLVMTLGLLAAARAAERMLWSALLIAAILSLLAFELSLHFCETHATHYPENAWDVAYAVRWAARHAHEWGGDPERLLLVGHSAGAHLTAMLLADERFFQRAGVPPHILRGFLGISGVYSARETQHSLMLRGLALDAFGACDERTLARMMPAERVCHHPAPAHLPPCLLLSANFDYGLHAHALHLRRALRRRGVHVRLEQVKDASHFTIVKYYDTKHLPLLRRILAFFRHVL
jgi:acetyl esterase/lipase